MATNEKSLAKLEREITCSMCEEHYVEPKVLPCLHYYCKKCVLELALRKASSRPFSCPECRQETTLPEGGVEELKTAFFINPLQSEVAALKQAYSKVDVYCEGCTDSDNKAEAFCHQCSEYVCNECMKQHKRMRAFAAHEVVSLNDLRNGQVKQLVKKQQPVKNCSIHEEPLIIYCFDCSTLVCRDCTMTSHRAHQFEFVKVAASNTKKKLLEEIVPLKDVVGRMDQVLEKILATRQEAESRGKSMSDTILTSFDELQQMLDKGKQQLLKKASSGVQQKLDRLATQENNLSKASAAVQSIIDYTVRLEEHCSDDEVMNIHTEIREKSH